MSNGEKMDAKNRLLYTYFFPYGCDVVFSIYSSCPAQLDLLGNFPVWIKSKQCILEHLNMEFQLNRFQVIYLRHSEFKQTGFLTNKKAHNITF